ncbi:phage tail protein [Escherichia coli]|uniref:phage tail protein n=2 Tax=Enterobacteriaceae TaxID=543 RepID=UPI00224B2983|nr:phage tail protein [Escherichia coli]UZR83396.1 phage tail protein [Escherichia coli]
MATKYFALLTNIGAAKLANATALGAQVEITQMAVGDGNGALPTPNPAQTALTHELRRAQLNMLTIDPVNTNQIIAEQVIPEDVGGWWIREIGLFDKDGDMIAVANCAETYKPQLQEGSGRVQVIRVILIVSSTEAVTLKIDPSVVLATRKYVDDAVIEVKAYADDVMKKHVAAANPHKQYPLIANALKEMVDAGLVNQILENLGLGEAAKRNVGTGENQIPDMSAYSSGSGWQKLPDGSIEQWGRINFPTNAAAVSTNVTFPIPFTQEPDVVIVYDGGFGGGNMWGATNWTRTGFVAHCNYGFEGGAFFAKGR